MTTNEYNEVRRRLGKSSLIFALSFMATSLFAAAKLIPLVFLSLFVMLVCAILSLGYLKQIKSFRCPQCGEDPTTWVSPNPADDAALCEQFTNRCLHCKAWLGEVI
jgi:hypothetical protein